MNANNVLPSQAVLDRLNKKQHEAYLNLRRWYEKHGEEVKKPKRKCIARMANRKNIDPE